MDLTAPLERTSFSVHRCRFVDWRPSEITAIAFSPLPPPNSKASKPSTSPASTYGVLAVGRGNGCIELCEWARESGISSQGWTIRRVLPGPNPSKVDSLAFSLKDPFSHPYGSSPGLPHLRLFSTAGGKELLEWDLVSGTIKRVIDSDAGAIWSIAVNPTSTVLALGCDDGSIRLLSLADGDVTRLKRLDRVNTRMLSLSWGPPRYSITPPSRESEYSGSEDDDDESRWKDTFLVAGCSDSSIRKWDITSGRVLERITTDQVRGEKTLVWAAQVLADGTIVTGDSLGCVRFWDPLANTQMHSFQAHDADVLCLTIGSDHQSVYASGVDQRVSEFALVSAGKNADSTQTQWIHTSSRRMHIHDVRCIAMWPPAQLFPKKFLQPTPRDKIAPVLATGGQDMSLTLTAIAPPSRAGSMVFSPFARGQASQIEDAFFRKMPYAQLGASGGRIVQCASKARFISCRHDTKFSIWRVLPLVPPSLEVSSVENTSWSKLLEMDIKTDTALLSSAISADGQWLAISDAYGTKLFRLLSETAQGHFRVRPKRVKSLGQELQDHLEGAASRLSGPQLGATTMQFTPDSRKLIIAISSRILVLELIDAAEPGSPRRIYGAKVIRSFAQHRQRNAAGSRNDRVIKPLPERIVSTMSGGDAPHGGDASSDEDNVLEESSSEDCSSHVSQMAVSADGQWLATSDLRGRTHVFNLDVVKHHCTLPTSPLPATALAFDSRPTSQHILVLAFPNNSIQVFDVESREFPPWARAVNERLPYGLSRLQDPIAGVSFIVDDVADSVEASSARGSRRSTSQASDRHNSRNVILWGRSWLCKVDLMGDTTLNNLPGPDLGGIRKRKKQSVDQPPDASKSNAATAQAGMEKEVLDQRPTQVITKYRDIMLVDFLGPKEMIVVERPAIDILQLLRPAFYKPKYGSK